MTNIAFFHTGNDQTIPTLMCQSAKLAFKGQDLQLIHIKDSTTEPNAQANTSFTASNLPDKQIMLARLSGYVQAARKINEPLIFVDTDMLFTATVRNQALRHSPVLCQRSFNLKAKGEIKVETPDGVLHPNLDTSKNLGELFPYLGCYLEVSDSLFLESMLDRFNQYDITLKTWYGDQIALKETAQQKPFQPKFVHEKSHACLPEKINTTPTGSIKILHFKGTRKQQMPHFLAAFLNIGSQATLQQLMG